MKFVNLKTNSFVPVLVMVLSLVATTISMSARKVNTVNASDFNACKVYLTNNPADTIVNETTVDANNVARRLVFLGSDGRVKARNDTVFDQVVAQSLTTSSSTVKVAEKQFKRVSDVSELSDAELNAINSGELTILDTHCSDYTGNSLQKLYWGLYGGGRFGIGGEVISPLAGIRLGYECHLFIYEFDAHYVIGKYVDGARAAGERFNSLAAEVRFGVKFLRSKDFRHYLAVVIGTGGEYQETDKDSFGGKTFNLAWTYKAGLQGYYSLNKRFGLFGGVYFGNVPHVEHNADQDLNHYAVSAEAGVRMNF